ncbi:MAG: hypothetical protein U1D30_10160 [Planctomycetota bacterium]
MSQSDLLGAVFVALMGCAARVIRGERTFSSILFNVVFFAIAAAAVLLLASGVNALLQQTPEYWKQFTNPIAILVDLCALLLLGMTAVGLRIHRLPHRLVGWVILWCRWMIELGRESMRNYPVFTITAMLFMLWLSLSTAFLGASLVLPLAAQSVLYFVVGGAQGMRPRAVLGMTVGILGATSLAFIGAYLDKSSTHGVILLFSAALFCFVQGMFFTLIDKDEETHSSASTHAGH